jgi:ribosome-binding factor A
MDERRTRRVEEALREEIAEIVGFEMEDPRLRFVDVTELAMSQDGRHATVKVAIQGDERERASALTALDHARGYLRGEIARRLDLRRVPELHFAEDRFRGVEDRIEVLLHRARKTRAKE